MNLYRTWAPVLLGAIIALIGFILGGGGVYLAILGGSLYYLVVGVLLIASGYLLIRRRIAGFYVYLAAFAFTALWTFWEVGLTGWPLIPRLVGPFVLLVLVTLIVPTLDSIGGQRLRRLALAGVALFAVVLAIAVPIVNRLPEPGRLPTAQAGAPFENPAYAPKNGEWDAYGGGVSAQRYSDLAQITPENVKDLKRAWTVHTGDIPDK